VPVRKFMFDFNIAFTQQQQHSASRRAESGSGAGAWSCELPSACLSFAICHLCLCLLSAAAACWLPSSCIPPMGFNHVHFIEVPAGL
jgi:hypothetical protein